MFFIISFTFCNKEYISNWGSYLIENNSLNISDDEIVPIINQHINNINSLFGSVPKSFFKIIIKSDNVKYSNTFNWSLGITQGNQIIIKDPSISHIKKDRFYYDKKFLGSMSGRPLRILSEYLGPLNTLQRNKIKDTIVFFGSARLKVDNEYYQKSKDLAYKLTKWNLKNFHFVEPAMHLLETSLRALIRRASRETAENDHVSTLRQSKVP